MGPRPIIDNFDRRSKFRDYRSRFRDYRSRFRENGAAFQGLRFKNGLWHFGFAATLLIWQLHRIRIK